VPGCQKCRAYDRAHRFFSHARWSAEDLGLVLAKGCDPVEDPACPQQKNDQGWNDGLIEYDPTYGSDHNYRVYPTKRFWALGNFSKFIRPGAVRHNVSGAPANLGVMAFQSRKSWQVVVINNDPVGAPSTALQLNLPCQTRLHAAGAFETSATRDLASVPGPTLTSTGMTASIPAQSVTTFLLHKKSARFPGTGCHTAGGRTRHCAELRSP